MDRGKLIERLMVVFLAELQEHIRVFNRELLSLEQKPAPESKAESIKVLFRAAHSLKGAARSVQATRLETLGHRLEEVLAAIRDGRRELDRPVFDQLFAAVDEFEACSKELAQNAKPASPAPAAASSGAQQPGSAQPSSAQAGAAQAVHAPPSDGQAAGAQPLPNRPAVQPPVGAQPLGMQPGAQPLGPQPGAGQAASTPPLGLQPAAQQVATQLAAGQAASPQQRGAPLLATQPAAGQPAAQPFTSQPGSPQPAGARLQGAPSQMGGAPRARADVLAGGVGAATLARNPGRKALLEDAAIVRVPRRRLDALLTQSGQLLVARRRFDARHGDVRALQDTVNSWRSEWRLAEQTLKRWQRQQRATLARSELPPRLERFFRSSGSQLARIERDIERLSVGFAEDRRTLERAAAPLQDQIHEARMVPFAESCEGLFRAVRDLASSLGKEAELTIDAGSTELDRSIIDGLRDPLLHLVRNAMSHGAETPEQRIAAGKPRAASIVVRASLHGDQVEVSVADDGRGIDLGSVAATALQRGLGAIGDERELLRLIFEPGFSTERTVSEVSGRGVGLDVVRSQIEAMRGNVQVEFQPGVGTRFILRLPLTLTTLRVLLVKAGGDSFALPSSSVRAMLRAGPSQLAAVAGRDTLLLGDAPIPIASLAQSLGLAASTVPRTGDKLPIVVIGADEQLVALAVDELVAEQDVVLKAFGPRIGRPRNFSGATVLASGQIALVLKPIELARAALGRAPSVEWSARAAVEAPNTLKRLLLVDDSITTRTLEKSILEAAGHLVTTASDGLNAWQILQEQGADLVVSDVEMPNMDGFTLTQTIRASKRFKDLPVILLTALHSEQDRARGLELGADAYLLKTTFDQKLLLETIAQLL